MTDDNDSDRNISQLRRMVLQGADYREEYELEYFGETTTLHLAPLKDEDFLELLEDLDEVMDASDFSEEDLDELDEDEMDEEDFDPEFVNIMRNAAKKGIDAERSGETTEGIAELLDLMVGGVSIEIGAEVMEITSNLQEADRFRRV